MPVLASLLIAMQAITAGVPGALDPVVRTLPDGSSVRVVKCYPHGKMRASCQSFDDGTLGSDWPVLDALRKRSIAATFFINSTHPQSKDAVKFPDRYAGFEVASHGANHKGLPGMSDEEVRSEIETDQHILGAAFHQVIDGFAYPCGAIPREEAALAKLEDKLRSFGLIYARGTITTKAFAPPADFIRWNLDCGFMDSLDKFLALLAEDTIRVRMCFMHSIDFARGQASFEAWEHILDALAADPTIWNATMRDYTRYVTALRALSVTDAGLKNDAPLAVWVRVKGTATEVPAHSILAWTNLHR